MLLGRKIKYFKLPAQYVLERKARTQGACVIRTGLGIKTLYPTTKNFVVVQTPRRFLCTTVGDPDSGIVESAALLDYETFNETSLAADSEDESYLRIQLYPGDSDVYLSKLYETSTIQQVFDVIEEIEGKNGTITLKHCSQALISLWDLQKLIFKLGPMFDPSKDFVNREQFIREIRSHDVFKEKILPYLVKNCSSLEDEALAASLLCLKRMQYDTRSPELEILIDECIKRKEVLTLPAVSRVNVSMRSESIYGMYIQANFIPLLMKYCKTMDNDVDVRLVSISMRNSQRILSTAMVEAYREKIEELLDKIEFETVTLCKILLSLVDTKIVGEDSSNLLRKVGNKLADKVPKMILLDLLSLQRFIENGSQEPFPLIEALVLRISRLIEENHPLRLDLIACIAPFMRNVYHHQKLFGILEEYMDNYEDFETIVYMMYKILRSVRFSDRTLYDKFWRKVLKLLTFETNNTRKVIRLAIDYTNFVQGLGTYRYAQFENKVKKLLYFYFDNYFSSTQPTIASPSDFARAFSFLLAFGTPNENDLIFLKTDYIETLDNLSPQLKIFDLTIIGRAVDISLQNASQGKSSSKYYDHILQICSILEEQISSRLIHRPEDLSTLDLIACARTQTHINKATKESPIFKESINLIIERGLTDSRMSKDLSNCLLASGGYNEPRVCNILAEFIEKIKFDLSPEVAEKFPILSFSSGFENDKFPHVFETCSQIIRRNLDKLLPLGILQSCLALCYYRGLSPELVNDIFSVEFIDEVDRGLRLTFGAAAAQMKVRQVFMELNRAVCIDMPGSNVPWFHKKFCEEIISVAPTKENYIHLEVQELLSDIFNSDPQVVQKNVYSPYYYLLDYLIEFDENNCPIKHPKKKSGIFRLQTPYNPAVAQEKVAILIHPSIAYTKNVRTLKGFYKLRERHLEILGYRLVSIDPQKWNSMCMSEPSVKSDFLESQIFKKQSVADKYAIINKGKD